MFGDGREFMRFQVLYFENSGKYTPLKAKFINVV